MVKPTPAAAELASVAVFRTTKPFRASVFTKAIPEIDRAARKYAGQLGGRVTSSETVDVARQRARQYVIEYGSLRQRISFLFRKRTEYFLVCRWKGADGEPDICSQLTETFRLA